MVTGENVEASNSNSDNSDGMKVFLEYSASVNETVYFRFSK
jgi:hypothetical protein